MNETTTATENEPKVISRLGAPVSRTARRRSMRHMNNALMRERDSSQQKIDSLSQRLIAMSALLVYIANAVGVTIPKTPEEAKQVNADMLLRERIAALVEIERKEKGSVK